MLLLDGTPTHSSSDIGDHSKYKNMLLPNSFTTYFGSRPQTDPDILPPGPASLGVHFFQVEIVFWREKNTKLL